MPIGWASTTASPKRRSARASRCSCVEAGGYTELQEADLADRGLRGRRRRCGDHRRHLLRRLEQPRRRDPQEEHPGDRRDQRHLVAGAFGEVARLVRRDGRQGRRVSWPSCIPRARGTVKVAWFPGPPGAGWVEAGNTGFPRRSRAAPSRSSTPSTATPARRCSRSWSRTRSRRIRT